MICQHCNSEHPPEAYAVGYFYVDGKVVKVEGEGEALAYGREHGIPVMWNEVVADRVLKHDGDFSEANFEEAVERFSLNEREAAIYRYGPSNPTEAAQIANKMKGAK